MDKIKKYTYDDIQNFNFYDSREYKETIEKNQYVLYRKHFENVVFEDNQTGYYITVIREIHEDDYYDSPISEKVVKQKIYLENELNKAQSYFNSDRK